MANIWNCCCSEHGELRAVYIEGHQPLSSIDLATERDAIAQAISGTIGMRAELAVEWLEEIEIEHFHVRDAFELAFEEAHADFPWCCCDAGSFGAIAVTGIRFKA